MHVHHNDAPLIAMSCWGMLLLAWLGFGAAALGPRLNRKGRCDITDFG
jgi:hypothetical protein